MGRLMTKRVRTGLAFAILVAQLLALVLVAPARGVSILWSITASPLTATTGVQKVFTLTAMNEDPLSALDSSAEIGCIVLDVPGNFAVAGAVVTGSNAGAGWHVDSIVGNRVTVHTDSGGDRLALLQWVRFTVTATPFKTGSLAWNARAFRQQDCTGSAALLGVPPIVVVTGPAVTPTPVPTPTPTPTPRPTPAPTPTPKPTPKPTPTPTPTPTPILPLPSVPLPLPSLPLPLPTSSPPSSSPPSLPLPSSDTPSSTPAPSAPDAAPRPTTPEASASPDDQAPAATPGSGSGGPPPASPPSDGTPSTAGGQPGIAGAPTDLFAPDAPSLAFEEGRFDLGTVGVDLVGGLGVWTVPAATLGVPGILLIVWVALQAIGALAWIPAVKKLRGSEEIAA